MAEIHLPDMAQIDLPGLAEIPWHIPYMTVTTSTRIGRNRATRYGMLLRLPTLVEIILPGMACYYMKKMFLPSTVDTLLFQLPNRP